MVVNQFQIVNNNNSKGLKFHWARSVTDNVTVKVVKFALAGGAATSNYARNWGGFDRIVTVDFALASDGTTDKSTSSDNIVGIWDQWEFLMETVIQGFSTSQNDVTYTLTIYIDGGTETFNGQVEDITITGTVDEANILRGTLNFTVASIS